MANMAAGHYKEADTQAFGRKVAAVCSSAVAYTQVARFFAAAAADMN